MANPGNGKSLLGGSGGEQGTGAAEQDPLQFPIPQTVQQITAEGDGTAAAAGSPCVYILGGVVEYQASAVRQLTAQRQMIPLSQFQENFLANLSQIPGDDQIKVLRLALEILHVGPYGVKCSRGHCQV